MATVLIVDDDREIRSALRHILEHAGHRVLEAKHGREALCIVDQHVPDIMLLDIMMPEMDGVETMLEMKRRECRFPVVAMPYSGTTIGSWSADVAKTLGAVEILEKPFTPKEVETIVDRIIKTFE